MLKSTFVTDAAECVSLGGNLALLCSSASRCDKAQFPEKIVMRWMEVEVLCHSRFVFTARWQSNYTSITRTHCEKRNISLTGLKSNPHDSFTKCFCDLFPCKQRKTSFMCLPDKKTTRPSKQLARTCSYSSSVIVNDLIHLQSWSYSDNKSHLRVFIF